MENNIINIILNFEKESKINEREIFGLKYWSLIRTFVLNDVITTIKNLSPLFDSKHKRKKTTWRILKNSIFTKKDFNKDILLITDTRRVLQNGKYESVYTDKLENILNEKYSTITLEEPSWVDGNQIKYAHSTPALTKNIKYIDIYEIKALALKKLYKFFNKKNLKCIREEIVSLFSLFEKKFNVDLSKFVDKYTDDLIYFLTMKKTYVKLIKKINPKCVFVYFRGFKFKALSLLILKELKIPIVEVQHGTIVEDSPIARKSCCANEWLAKPDYLFAFGEKQVNQTNLIYDNEHIKYVGNLFLEEKLKTQYDFPNEYDKNKKYILIISQSVIGQYMSEVAVELAKLLENDSEYMVAFKYHPTECERKYENLQRKNILELKDPSKEIYQYQKYAYAQIGIFSTALYEGISFKLPTFVLKNPIGTVGTVKMLSYFKNGVYLEKNLEEIVNLLKGTLTIPDDDDIKLLWKSNAKENFIKELEKILNNKEN